jgi:hypothetical protein
MTLGGFETVLKRSSSSRARALFSVSMLSGGGNDTMVSCSALFAER